MNANNVISTWVSHSSISDFIKCPKGYYLHNVYRDPMTGNKIALVNPSLTLGQTVHETLESLLKFHAEDRAAVPLLDKY